MKKIVLSLFILSITALASAQEFPKNDKGQITYEEVVKVENKTKEQLFRQARKWMTDNFVQDNQDDDVIYASDSYLGELAANPYMWMELTNFGSVINAGAILYDIKIDIKDGRFRYQIVNPYHEAQRSRLGTGGALEDAEPDCGLINMQQKYWDDIKVQAHANFTALIASLKETMSTASGEGEDW
jgi:hypothetical protein